MEHVQRSVKRGVPSRLQQRNIISLRQLEKRQDVVFSPSGRARACSLQAIYGALARPTLSS